jgi:hypothetical protein
MSPYHNTVYIAGPDNFGTFNWGLPYAIEGGNPNINNYDLICDTAGLNNWFTVGVVSGNQGSVTDANFTSHVNTPRWRVKTDWNISCAPTRIINTSRSNIKHSISLSIPISTLDIAVAIYPNPAKDNVTIELSSLIKNGELKIVNVLGETVYNETVIASSGKTTKQINTSNFAKGVYMVIVESNTAKIIKNLVVN